MASTTTATCCDTATSKQTKACARASHVTHDITATHAWGGTRTATRERGRARDPFYVAGPRTRSNECLDRFVRDTNNLYTPFAVPFRLFHCRFHPSLMTAAPRPTGPLHPRTTLAACTKSAVDHPSDSLIPDSVNVCQTSVSYTSPKDF